MATIILNDTSFPLTSFTRNTTFTADTINSYCYCSINYNNDEESDTLYNLAQAPITSLIIKNSNNESIYTLENLNAHITNLDEILNGESIATNLNIQF